MRTPRRASTLALISLVIAIAGCGGALVGPDGIVESSVHTPPPDPTKTCFEICPSTSNKLADPWKGGRGYILVKAPTTPSGSFVLVGVSATDPTLSTALWVAIVDTQAEVDAYERLPGTLQFSAPINPQVGQIGSGNTNTGGGNCMDEFQVCWPKSYLASLGVCQPAPAQACAQQGNSCGPSVDNCGNPISCGSCGPLSSCQAGSCVCKTRACPKGSYAGDDCACVKGTPI